jgi:hypothetical protein
MRHGFVGPPQNTSENEASTSTCGVGTGNAIIDSVLGRNWKLKSDRGCAKPPRFRFNEREFTFTVQAFAYANHESSSISCPRADATVQ